MPSAKDLALRASSIESSSSMKPTPQEWTTPTKSVFRLNVRLTIGVTSRIKCMSNAIWFNMFGRWTFTATTRSSASVPPSPCTIAW
ncbi:hypothetical protein ACHAWF_006825, partial [Thalassiosira exigua]